MQIDEGDLEDVPLSDHGRNSDNDQEMASADDGVGRGYGGLTPYNHPGKGLLSQVWAST